MRCAFASATSLFLLLATAASAQDEDLKEKLAEKLQKPFASNAAWVLRFEDAKKLAGEKGKVIFAYFSRSYAP